MGRYLETAALVYSWYLDDCWDEESVASKMIRRVNSMHRLMFRLYHIIQKSFVLLCKVYCGEGQANWVLRTVRECVQGV